MGKTSLLLVLIFLHSQIYAQLIEPPEINVSVYGQLVSITWSEIELAHSYRLYYAPYPDAEVVDNVILGPLVSLFAELPLQSAYYLAVTAITDAGESEISNVEWFTVVQEQLDSEIEANN